MMQHTYTESLLPSRPERHDGYMGIIGKKRLKARGPNHIHFIHNSHLPPLSLATLQAPAGTDLRGMDWAAGLEGKAKSETPGWAYTGPKTTGTGVHSDPEDQGLYERAFRVPVPMEANENPDIHSQIQT